MAVCALAMKHDGKLSGNAIVATVMSNLGLHEFCRNHGIDLVCTDVGDRHVLEKMIECGYAIGGEQSGHTIFRDYATTGDGELTGAAVPAGAACLGPARLRVRLLLQTVSAGAYQRRRTALRRREGAHHGRRDRLGTGARARGGARG